MAKYIPYELISHTRKISGLYKRYVRNLESWDHHRHSFRFKAAVARSEFDVILREKDMIKAKQMIEDKEREYFAMKHYQLKIFPHSPGGTAYEREVIPPDWILDYWHPQEKAQFPEYFARRELRKQQYVQMWEKQYGPPPKEPSH